MSPSKALFFLCIAFVVGIFLESIIKIPQIFVWGFLILSILAILAVVGFLAGGKNPTTIIILGFCMLFLVLGIIRVQIAEFNIANDKLSKFNGTGKVTFTGVVNSEPDIRDKVQMLKVKVGQSVVLVTVERYPEYKYLDVVKLTGKLEEPGATDSFNYKNYLMKDGIYSVMAFPKISAPLGRDLASGGEVTIMQKVYSGILFCKEKIRQSIQHNFLPPQSSILEGTILGDNGAMTSDLKTKLNITGLRHIIAVSGTHVVILSAIIMYLLLALGLWRGQAFYVALVIICVYIVLTGLPPSGVRAGIMGGIYLLSQKIGRQTMAPRLLTLAGAVMLLINPLLLIYDVGFQLSFIAVLGLIYLEPIIKRAIMHLLRFLKRESRAGDVVSAVSATLAAQVFTLPIMVYNFGNISFVSIVTNILIAPVVSLLMIFGFLASIAGIFSNILGWILSVPCWFLLTYFVKVIDFFSKPWAMKTVQGIHWIWLAIAYLVIAIGTRFLNKKYKRDFVV